MQPYQPADTVSFDKESLPSHQARVAGDAILRDYESKQHKLSQAIDAAQYLVGDLKNFNNDQWKIRYPHFAQPDSSTGRPANRRTLTFADEPASSSEVVLSSRRTPRPGQLKRSVTFANDGDITDEPSEIQDDAASSSRSEDFSILHLDLNLGATRHAKSLISTLERSSISALLDNRLTAALEHLSLLQARVHDPHSRVLVTGDLNAGKSTLINALLRRNEVMPTDQQPLTTRFVEVVNARENNDKEEIHVLESTVTYNPADESTYKVAPLDKLEDLATDEENDPSAPPLRVFLQDTGEQLSNPSILHNGVVDISLIDAPGLNRDSIKTTANFARQEEIDVVVFVVSAANHFTLSAKEFIWQAGHEKAHLFIVVNRFDQIRAKDRCRRAVMEQIKQLSPETYEDAKDLVHFVDSASVALGFEEGQDGGEAVDEAFAHLEQSLRSFVLVNRAKSKLGPAQNYMTHLLADVELLASSNTIVATKERDSALAEVERVKPELERMKKGKDNLEGSLATEEEAVTQKSISTSRGSLRAALDRVGRGEFADGVPVPMYPGLLGAWDYAHEVRRALLASLDLAVTRAENEARAITAIAVKDVTAIGNEHLPADVERSKRVFNPNAMFFSPASKKGRRTSGLQNVGLGLAANSALTDVHVTDILDLQHLLSFSSSVPAEPSEKRDLIPSSVPAEVGGISAVALGLGAFSMAGGKTMALRTVVEGIVHLSDLAQNPAVRKWAGPAIGAVIIGAVAYVVYELPRSIPRNVGRHMRASLLVSSGMPSDHPDDEVSFSDAEAERIGREVRKVIRLASWDLCDRFKAALEVRGEIVRKSEETAQEAAAALAWFTEVGERVDAIRAQLGLQL